MGIPDLKKRHAHLSLSANNHHEKTNKILTFPINPTNQLITNLTTIAREVEAFTKNFIKGSYTRETVKVMAIV